MICFISLSREIFRVRYRGACADTISSRLLSQNYFLRTCGTPVCTVAAGIRWFFLCHQYEQTQIMDHSAKNFSRDITIVNELGLHARSAAKIAEIARHAKSDVRIIRDNEDVDAKSVIDMLTLACAKGSSITIKIDCHADMDILNRITALVENGFGE